MCLSWLTGNFSPWYTADNDFFDYANVWRVWPQMSECFVTRRSAESSRVSPRLQHPRLLRSQAITWTVRNARWLDEDDPPWYWMIVIAPWGTAARPSLVVAGTISVVPASPEVGRTLFGGLSYASERGMWSCYVLTSTCTPRTVGGASSVKHPLENRCNPPRS